MVLRSAAPLCPGGDSDGPWTFCEGGIAISLGPTQIHYIVAAAVGSDAWECLCGAQFHFDDAEWVISA